MHLLYIALMIFWKRIQQIKNVTEKEKNLLRSKSFLLMYCFQNILSLNAKSLISERHSSLPQRLHEGVCPMVGS